MPGGMAQVLNEYVSWNYSGFEVERVASTRGRHDPLSPLLWVKALALLVLKRFQYGGRTVIAVHLSERGSFVREGSVVLLARTLGFRVTTHLHGSEFAEFLEGNRKLVRSVLGASRLVWVLTDDAQSQVNALFEGRNRSPQVQKIANAVSLPQLPGAKVKHVLFGGEIGTRKGADVLFGAWEQIAPSVRAGWTLLLVGPIAMDMSKVEIGDDVEVRLPVGRLDMRKLQLAASIAVLPSRHEALPMFLIESMASGCAVISTPVGQIAQLLDDGSGLLVETENSADLAAKLSSLMIDDDRRNELGRQARTRIERSYSEDAVKSELERAWLSLVES